MIHDAMHFSFNVLHDALDVIHTAQYYMVANFYLRLPAISTGMHLNLSSGTPETGTCRICLK